MSERTERRTKPKRTGTREWSAVSKNNGFGCAHGCLYCYARADAMRWGKLKRGEDWAKERINAGYRIPMTRHRGVVMFPTTHDVTPENMVWHLTYLWSLLDADNRVLWVSKPHLPVVEAALAVLERRPAWKWTLDVRFTIGADDDRVLHAWEPGAPAFEERLACLRLAALAGLQTSVSCEPLLDPLHAPRLVERLAPHVTDTRPEGGIWIGALNKARARCAWYLKDHPEFEATLAELEEQQTDAAVVGVAAALGRLPKATGALLRWKDSYRAVVAP